MSDSWRLDLWRVVVLMIILIVGISFLRLYGYKFSKNASQHASLAYEYRVSLFVGHQTPERVIEELIESGDPAKHKKIIRDEEFALECVLHQVALDGFKFVDYEPPYLIFERPVQDE